MADNQGKVDIPEEDSDHLVRSMENRHLQMIAIGGAIGTGLFMGSGNTIATTGPSIVIVYAVIGLFLFFVMRAMGEILLSNLAYKSFADFCGDLIGPWAGYYVGWTYWCIWILMGMSDTTAVAGYIKEWWPNTPGWIPVLAVIVLMFVINAATARAFGEMEFWFSAIKVVTIIALIIVGVVLIAMGFTSPDGQSHAAVSNLWSYGGMFPGGIVGFITVFPLAIYSFQGVEMVGIAVGETSNPRKNLPRAVNSVQIRVLVFYVLALAIIMSVMPWTNFDKDHSPFIMTFELIGITFAAAIITFVCITAAASSANSGMYSSSRIMYGLANDKDAPKVFCHLSKNHVPVRALLLTAICMLPACYIVMAGGSVGAVFATLTSISAILYITVWGMIMVAYLFFIRRHPERHAESAFKLPGGTFTAWATIIFFVIVFGFITYVPDSRLLMLALPAWFVFLLLMWKFMNIRRKAEGVVRVDWDAERIKAEEKMNAWEAKNSQKEGSQKEGSRAQTN
ncbi:MAG: amino acid permease [Actinomycetaceae bacterium]|nr:amino acid permease [Actinomycetaceae bacterium]MDY6082272.1 amino acid permease [Actinomycetaceae bacterium]